MQNKTLVLSIALSLVTSVASAAPWSYRGTLNDGGQPANGSYDIRVTLLSEDHDASITSPITFHDVVVENGQFAIDVDFGMDLGGASAMRLQTEVQQADSGFVALGEPTRFDPKAALGSMCWDTTGNAGTNVSSNFLGTTDNEPLVLRTRNVQSLRIEPSAELNSGNPVTANIIAGSSANRSRSGVRGATISGGGTTNGDPDFGNFNENSVNAHFATIGGGLRNEAGASSGAMGDSAFATISGGRSNSAEGLYSAIGGGYLNDATGDRSIVSGGGVNTAGGAYSAVAGGIANDAFGEGSFASGGAGNCAGGDYSWGGGKRASIRPADSAESTDCVGIPRSGDSDGDEGSFLWGGDSEVTFATTGPNQFGVRAAGVYFGSVNASTVDLPAGRFINTASGAHLTTGGTWTNASSRTLKTAFEGIDPMAVLGKVVSLPLSTWSYKASVEGRHLGPMAEDFKQAFGLGGDGKSISTVDADGIALAAIQGLNQKGNMAMTAIQDLNRKLDAENAALKIALAAVEARLRVIEGGR